MCVCECKLVNVLCARFQFTVVSQAAHRTVDHHLISLRASTVIDIVIKRTKERERKRENQHHHHHSLAVGCKLLLLLLLFRTANHPLKQIKQWQWFCFIASFSLKLSTSLTFQQMLLLLLLFTYSSRHRAHLLWPPIDSRSSSSWLWLNASSYTQAHCWHTLLRVRNEVVVVEAAAAVVVVGGVLYSLALASD